MRKSGVPAQMMSAAPAQRARQRFAAKYSSRVTPAPSLAPADSADRKWKDADEVPTKLPSVPAALAPFSGHATGIPTGAHPLPLVA